MPMLTSCLSCIKSSFFNLTHPSLSLVPIERGKHVPCMPIPLHLGVFNRKKYGPYAPATNPLPSLKSCFHCLESWICEIVNSPSGVRQSPFLFLSPMFLPTQIGARNIVSEFSITYSVNFVLLTTIYGAFAHAT